MSHYSLIMESANGKTGPIPVSYTSKDTCPPDCAFYHTPDDDGQGGCYGGTGPVALHWDKVSSGARGVGFHDFTRQVARLPLEQLWRYAVAGDLPGYHELINEHDLKQLVYANASRPVIAYTHKYNAPGNLELLRFANEHGFTVNLSANSPAHADALSAYGLPVVTALPIHRASDPRSLLTPGGRRVLVCPAVTHECVTCKTCKLCSKRDRYDQSTGHRLIIGFPAHGSQKTLVHSIVERGAK